MLILQEEKGFRKDLKLMTKRSKDIKKLKQIKDKILKVKEDNKK